MIVGSGGGSDWSGGGHTDTYDFSSSGCRCSSCFEESGEAVAGIFYSAFGKCVDRSPARHSAFGIDKGCADVGATDVGGEGVLNV